MLFHSLEYALFLPLVALIYHAVPARHRSSVLVAAGVAFLAYASPIHAAAALVMVGVNFGCGLALARWADTPWGARVLWPALIFDVGALGYFKYQGFFVEIVNGLGALLGVPLELHARAVLLPLGISYYTFQLIGYLLEIYWGRQAAERHVGRFAASILFFPKLLAGPIERPHRFLGQLGAERPFDADEAAAGLARIGWGLFKKCVIADRIGRLVDLVYQSPRDLVGLPLLVGVLLYPLQVYNDFSGYTDIALGSARVLGFDLAENFDDPFSARSVTEFWRRWHISLSSWTNDYIYKPLSMYVSLETGWGKAGVVFSILVTFLVLGLWHGPTFGFVLFGLLHGAAVSIEILSQRARKRASTRLPAWLTDRLGQARTLAFYSVSCVFFRARTVPDAIHVLGHSLRGLGQLGSLRLFSAQPNTVRWLAVVVAVLTVLRVLSRGRRPLEWLTAQPTWVRWSLYYALVTAILVLGLFEVNQFVYVQF